MSLMRKHFSSRQSDGGRGDGRNEQSDDENDIENDCFCPSPLRFCRPFMCGNENISHIDKGTQAPSIQGGGSDISIASWQERAAKKILSDELELEEQYLPNRNAREEILKSQKISDRKFSSSGSSTATRQSSAMKLTSISRSDDVLQDNESYNLSTEDDMKESMTTQSESVIVAPNVDKLSPLSTVEVRLQSINEGVAIVCSVDVLKMRSRFFHEILSEQENAQNDRRAETNNPPSMREPLLIPEQSPFEAAAFLESLHEGRTLFSGEWSYAWARLR
jgi:hypothetical protein